MTGDKMKYIKAAIIDDGANPALFRNVSNFIISRNLKVTESDLSVKYGIHATLCMSVINKYTDISDIHWLNIQIINIETGRSSHEQFIRALEFCEEQDVKLIHLSLGTREYSDFPEIETKINVLLEKETVIVAALSNEGTLTYPACIDGVIGVKEDNREKDFNYLYVDDAIDNVNFLAPANHLIRIGGKLEFIERSNSFAAPVITAKVIEILRKDSNMSIEKVKEKLKKNAVCHVSAGSFKEYMDINEEDITVPLIGVFMKDESSAASLAKELNLLFIYNEYKAIYCSSRENGLFKFPATDILKYLLFLTKFSCCDIIIAGFSDKEIIRNSIPFDIILTDVNGQVPYITEEDTSVIMVEGKSVSEIYSSVIKNFKE